jgi:hypothetical protein
MFYIDFTHTIMRADDAGLCDGHGHGHDCDAQWLCHDAQWLCHDARHDAQWLCHDAQNAWSRHVAGFSSQNIFPHHPWIQTHESYILSRLAMFPHCTVFHRC